uniref:C2H2-type domain-containing protein n=1 Tax=Romanomermis culicivorax TaxID=13658 RepID=A0A915IMU2_ROMCU
MVNFKLENLGGRDYCRREKSPNLKLENLDEEVADPLPPLLPDTPYNRRKRNAAAIKLGSVAALQCDRCDKKFAFHSGLRMHMKMVHSGFKFTCQYCGLNFTNGYAIHRHVNIVHNIS